MTRENAQLTPEETAKATELGLSKEFMLCALNILSQNRDFVNAIDNRTEMDEYIYRGIMKNSMDKRRKRAEEDIEHEDETIRTQAERELSLLSKEELITDPYYRAVLPMVIKILVNEPILRLHAEEAAAIVLELADFKRRHRSTSVTEVIVRRCSEELNNFHLADNSKNFEVSIANEPLSWQPK